LAVDGGYRQGGRKDRDQTQRGGEKGRERGEGLP